MPYPSETSQDILNLFQRIKSVGTTVNVPTDPTLTGILPAYLRCQQLHQETSLPWLKINILEHLIKQSTWIIESFADLKNIQEPGVFAYPFSNSIEGECKSVENLRSVETPFYHEYQFNDHKPPIICKISHSKIPELNNFKYEAKLDENNQLIIPKIEDELNLKLGKFELNHSIFKIENNKALVDITEYPLTPKNPDDLKLHLIAINLHYLLASMMIGMTPSAYTENYFNILAIDQEKLLHIFKIFYIKYFINYSDAEKFLCREILKNFLNIKIKETPIPALYILMIAADYEEILNTDVYLEKLYLENFTQHTHVKSLEKSKPKLDIKDDTHEKNQSHSNYEIPIKINSNKKITNQEKNKNTENKVYNNNESLLLNIHEFIKITQEKIEKKLDFLNKITRSMKTGLIDSFKKQQEKLSNLEKIFKELDKLKILCTKDFQKNNNKQKEFDLLRKTISNQINIFNNMIIELQKIKEKLENEHSEIKQKLLALKSKSEQYQTDKMNGIINEIDNLLKSLNFTNILDLKQKYNTLKEKFQNLDNLYKKQMGNVKKTKSQFAPPSPELSSTAQPSDPFYENFIKPRLNNLIIYTIFTYPNFSKNIMPILASIFAYKNFKNTQNMRIPFNIPENVLLLFSGFATLISLLVLNLTLNSKKSTASEINFYSIVLIATASLTLAVGIPITNNAIEKLNSKAAHHEVLAPNERIEMFFNLFFLIISTIAIYKGYLKNKSEQAPATKNQFKLNPA